MDRESIDAVTNETREVSADGRFPDKPEASAVNAGDLRPENVSTRSYIS
jgi:hypothetical protein